MTNNNELATSYPPLRSRDVAIRLLGGGLLLAACLSFIGWAIVSWATPSALTRWDDSVERWFYKSRTQTLNSITHVGTYMAETITCVILVALLMALLRLWLGRWRESWTLFAALAGQLVIVLIVTAVVNRPRPTVPHLDAAPPTSSFPSGHTSAAIALYGCLAIILLRQMRPRWLAITLASLLFLVPIFVGISRLYRGMHHPTDVIFGAVNGAVWLTLVVSTLLPRPRHKDAPAAQVPAPANPENSVVT